MASRTRADRQPARDHSSTSPSSTASRIFRPMFRLLRTFRTCRQHRTYRRFGHAPPDWPRFHDAVHRWCLLTHALHPAYCTPALHTRHTATRHPARKPPAASHTGHTRPRLPAFHTTPSRSSRIVHAVSPLPTSRTAPLAFAAFPLVALACLAPPEALAAAAAAFVAADDGDAAQCR